MPGLYDGNYTTAFQCGPARYWQDEFTRSRLYTVPMQVLASSWTAATIMAAGPSGGYLVEETQPRDVGAGILEWERIYADVPAAFSREEMFAYPLQLVVTTASGQDLAEIAVNTPVQVNYSYTKTTTPWTVPITRAYRVTKVGSTLYYVGTPFSPPLNNIQAADTVITRWKGDIYQSKDLILSIPGLIKSGS